jgi:hypothetical protein
MAKNDNVLFVPECENIFQGHAKYICDLRIIQFNSGFYPNAAF